MLIQGDYIGNQELRKTGTVLFGEIEVSMSILTTLDLGSVAPRKSIHLPTYIYKGRHVLKMGDVRYIKYTLTLASYTRYD